MSRCNEENIRIKIVRYKEENSHGEEVKWEKDYNRGEKALHHKQRKMVVLMKASKN
jgi:hypothetical protein